MNSCTALGVPLFVMMVVEMVLIVELKPLFSVPNTFAHHKQVSGVMYVA